MYEVYRGAGSVERAQAAFSCTKTMCAQLFGVRCIPPPPHPHPRAAARYPIATTVDITRSSRRSVSNGVHLRVVNWQCMCVPDATRRPSVPLQLTTALPALSMSSCENNCADCPPPDRRAAGLGGRGRQRRVAQRRRAPLRAPGPAPAPAPAPRPRALGHNYLLVSRARARHAAHPLAAASLPRDLCMAQATARRLSRTC